tara:strand:+ start:392 stop:1291 length:900 start_codon:yes stop_codon:yes gene_type:complete
MDISNNLTNDSESPSNNSEPNNNDFSNIDNILEEYITNILASQPPRAPPSAERPVNPTQNLLPSPPPMPPVQLNPFSGSTPFENDPMFRFMNQLFSVPTTRHSRYVVPYNPSDNILLQSFNEKPVYKKVLSEKGEEQLKEIKFSDSDKTNDTCPIFQMTFDDDDMVIQLPCKHIFTPDGIRKWLNEEQAICPVCRYELDSKEVKIKKEFRSRRVNNSENEDDDDTDTDPEMPELVDDDDDEEQPRRNITHSRIALIRSLANLANNTHISTRTTGFSMLDQEEEDDLQAAIYASLQTNDD